MTWGFRSRILLAFSLIVFAARARAAPPFDDVAQTAVTKLRTFCTACHGIGNLRFIRSEDDREVWNYIYLNKAPNSQKLWAENILQVLSWPTDVPPPFDQPMDPGNNRDWMPKGAKRLSFSTDKVGDMATRKFLLEALRPDRQDPEWAE